MNDTALKVSAKELIAEFEELHGNTDLMRVAMITGSADMSRTYENLKGWSKNASEGDKAIFNNALKILEQLTVKRVIITNILYGGKLDELLVSLLQPTSEVNETTEPEITSEGAKVIEMLPKLNDTLERVRTILRVSRVVPNGSEDNAATEAFKILKVTVGQGKVLNTDGQPETWDNNKIYGFIKDNTVNVVLESPADTLLTNPIKDKTNLIFETIYGHFNKLIHDGKTEPEIKESIKSLIMGQLIKNRDASGDLFIKDDAVFEDYYTRMLSNIVIMGIVAFNKANEKQEPTGKIQEISKKVEEEIKPFLEEQEKDPTQSSLSSITKKMRDLYKGFGINKTLGTLFFETKELAAKYAPNLAKRNKTANKDNIPLTTPIEKDLSIEGPEIYDESHNIEQSNKPLWEEVKNFTYLNELYTKAVELYKAGQWKDALSMSIALITQGKIKETATSTTVLPWDISQVKLWYYNIVEASVEKEQPKTVEVKAEVVKDEAKTVIADVVTPEPVTDTAITENKVETPESNNQGPVPQIGTVDSKENLTRLLKDSTIWKDMYQLRSFIVKTDHYRDGAMFLEIVDATSEQEKDLFITEHNMTKYIDGLRDRLVTRRNEERDVRKELYTKFSEYYQVTNSETKRIVSSLVKEADEIRREAKNADRAAKTTIPEVIIPEVEVPVVIPPEIVNPKVEEVKEEITDSKSDTPVVVPDTKDGAGETLPIDVGSNKDTSSTKDETVTAKVEISVDANPTQPAEEKKEESAVSQKDTTIIDKSAGEEASNSNEPTPYEGAGPYEGFDEVLDAKKKAEFHKAIFDTVNKYASPEEGIKAVHTVIEIARKDDHYKKAFLRNYKGSQPVDILAAVNNAYTLGVEHAKVLVEIT